MKDLTSVTSERSRRLLARIVHSLPGGRRPPMGGRSWKPVRTLPLLAVGALGFTAAVRWPAPEAVAPDALAEVDRLGSGDLPLEVNARVEKWMRRFMTDQRKTFETFLSREGVYAPLIRGKLRERGMPQDLLYLAMIESGFSTRATSPVGAGGVWQFMRPTAKEYGLRVDRWIDERRDPVKATDAALDYLVWLHERYGSWYLAAAAYNAGFGRVDKVLKRYASACRLLPPQPASSKGRKSGPCVKGDDAVYWEIIDHLPRETRDYVPKILAATTLAREAQRYGFRVSGEAMPYAYERIWVPGGTRLSVVAKEVGIDMTLLKELNPHLIRSMTPPGASYGLRIPVGSTHDVIAAMGGRRPLTRHGD